MAFHWVNCHSLLLWLRYPSDKSSCIMLSPCRLKHTSLSTWKPNCICSILRERKKSVHIDYLVPKVFTSTYGNKYVHRYTYVHEKQPMFKYTLVNSVFSIYSTRNSYYQEIIRFFLTLFLDEMSDFERANLRMFESRYQMKSKLVNVVNCTHLLLVQFN